MFLPIVSHVKIRVVQLCFYFVLMKEICQKKNNFTVLSSLTLFKIFRHMVYRPPGSFALGPTIVKDGHVKCGMQLDLYIMIWLI